MTKKWQKTGFSKRQKSKFIPLQLQTGNTEVVWWNLQNKYYEPGFSYWGSDKKPPVAENFLIPHHQKIENILKTKTSTQIIFHDYRPKNSNILAAKRLF